MYYPRTIENTLLRMSKEFACLMVYGPRQVGKSTVVSHLFSSFSQVTLDDIDDLTLALDNPKLFLDNYSWPLVIDEIQKAPKLLDEIKRRVDAQKKEWLFQGEPYRLMYVLTGSNQFELQQGISEALAGRAGILDMNSFSMAEKELRQGEPFIPDLALLQKKEGQSGKTYTRKEIFVQIFEGGMPERVQGISTREDFYKSYVTTYMEKDVRKLIQASSLNAFRTFLTLVALRTGQELHYDDLANGCGVDARTIKQWISILSTSGLILLLQPYLANANRRIIKAPKLYFMDTGLCAYLCGWPNAEMLENSSMAGAFFETFVVSEIVKNFQAANLDYRNVLFTYRDIDQKEIDLLYVKEQTITPIEIKKGVRPSKPSKNFSVLSKYGMPIRTGFVIDATDRIRPINENVYAIPVGLVD